MLNKEHEKDVNNILNAAPCLQAMEHNTIRRAAIENRIIALPNSYHRFLFLDL